MWMGGPPSVDWLVGWSVSITPPAPPPPLSGAEATTGQGQVTILGKNEIHESADIIFEVGRNVLRGRLMRWLARMYPGYMHERITTLSRTQRDTIYSPHTTR